ncbi:MAG: hypothetical protein EXR72_25285 [Myxococcales bacterium]|nr:hypothetical protein [Myxococcales bacterium]
MAPVRAVSLAAALILVAAAPARAEYFAPPFLIDTSFGFGIEPHDRAPTQCSKRVTTGGVTETVGVPQCNLVLAFGVGVEALWRGLIGVGIGLYAAEGSPVQVVNKPSFGDRVSVPLAVAVRPFAPLSWRRGDGFAWRLLAGVGLQVGVSVEHTRTALETQTTAGFHGALLLDVPLHGGNTLSGLSLRLSARILATRDAQLVKDERTGAFAVDQPGTAVQLMAGIAYYL